MPQILLLFLFFSILEDSGYMARIAFVLDRIFRKFGVSGRAFLPMVMGFGCAVPAMINTRTLSSDKERTKTIRVIPFFTCGAKAEFLVAIAAAVAAVMGFDAGLFTFLIYLLGVSVAICSVIVMNKTTQREIVPPFIMELPAYHRPQFKALMIHVWDKGKHFIKKAFTIIFVSTVVIWLFSNFTWNWQFIPTADEALGLSDGDSILAGLAMFIQPIFTPMGFGYNTDALRQTGWVYTVASVQGIVAKEAVTSSLEALGAVVADGGGFEDLVALSGISSAGLTAFAVFNLLTIPCFASLGAAKGELASKKDYVLTILFWICLSYVLGVLTYITFEYVWTLAITLPLLAGAIVGFCFYDRYKSKQEAKLAK
ncbi:MAG: ferrous iron transporter B [Bacilli bacterium]|nr:ferrous iron transporter B [Bacilli bacterium]